MLSPRCVVNPPRVAVKKIAGLKEPGWKYWPYEADTITFQEGFPSARATGGGGKCATRSLSTEPLWSLALPRRNHATRMSDMRKSGLRMSGRAALE